jgi:hypothetical protein
MMMFDAGDDGEEGAKKGWKQQEGASQTRAQERGP